MRDMRQLIERIKQKARTDRKVIVFPESTDYRILNGCRAAVDQGISSPVLIGERPEIEAAAMVRDRDPDLVVDGEMQVDAALDPETCERKYPGST